MTSRTVQGISLHQIKSSWKVIKLIEAYIIIIGKNSPSLTPSKQLNKNKNRRNYLQYKCNNKSDRLFCNLHSHHVHPSIKPHVVCWMTVHTPGMWCRVRLFELCELVHTEALLINGNVNAIPAIIYTHTHQRDKGRKKWHIHLEGWISKQKQNQLICLKMRDKQKKKQTQTFICMVIQQYDTFDSV